MSAMPRGRPPLDVVRVWTLHQQGVPIAAIATRMGYERRTVQSAIQSERERRAGLPTISSQSQGSERR